jgi:homospermidine synthase
VASSTRSPTVTPYNNVPIRSARRFAICMPYLGPVVGRYGDWTPLKDRDGLFPEDLDESDPWQFKNFRVV